jgi:polysaccharide biosynthesis transport protein
MSKLVQANTSNKPAPKQNAQFSPYSLLRSIWNHKMVVAGVWLATTLAVLAVVMRLPRTYGAEATILIESPRVDPKYVQSAVGDQLQDRMEQMKQQILSYSRLIQLMEKFGMYEAERKSMNTERVIEKLKDDLKMKLDRGWGTGSANTFKISFQGRDPKTTAEVVNYVARFFVNKNQETRQGESSATEGFLKEKLDEAKAAMESAASRLNQIKMQYNGELPQQEQALIAMLGTYRTQQQGSQDAINRAQQNKMVLANSLDMARSSQSQLRALADQAAGARRAAARAVATGQPAMPAQVQRVLASARIAAELEALRDRYSDQHPEVRRKVAQYNDAKAEEAREMASAPPAPKATQEQAAMTLPPAAPDRDFSTDLIMANERVETIKTQITVANNEISNLEKDRIRLAGEIASLESRISRLPLREQQLAGVAQDYSVAKQNYEAIRDNHLRASMSKDVEKEQKGEKFTLLDAARIPTEPIKPARTMLAMAGALAGLLLGGLAAVGIDMKRDVFLGEWELPAGTPVLGRVVYIPANHGDSMTRVTKWA